MSGLYRWLNAGAFFILSSSACSATVALSPAAARILLVRYDAHRAHLTPLGPLTCRTELTGEGHDANAIACETQLLNAAARLGATVVVVDSMQVDLDHAAMQATAYRDAAP